MGLFSWIESYIQKMKWYDISLIKASVLFAVLFLMTIAPAVADWLLAIAWYWYLGLFVIVMIPILKKLFSP